ncbi:MAG: hypothetical protein E7311_00435 [Clostridiales bacterium]|nr:hypothetical protein [Clostridiales bacterium]
MKKIKININQDVSLKIFEKKGIEDHKDFLFNVLNDKISERFSFMKDCFKEKEIREIKYEDYLMCFKCYFLKKVANEATHNIFEDTTNDSIRNAVFKALTYESLEESIYGYDSVKAFERCIKMIPDPVSFMKGYVIMKLRTEFLNGSFNPFSRKLKQKNKCKDCGCECRCDGMCEGDTNKCTSPHSKDCNHHCNCWAGPLAEKTEKRVIETKQINN